MRRRSVFRIGLAVAGAGYCAAAVIAFAANRGGATTYAALSAGAGVAFLVAGLGLLLAGAWGMLDAGTGTLPGLCVLAAVAWLSPELAGWDTGPALLRSVGVGLGPFLVPLLAQIALTGPDGHLRSSRGRVAVTIAYGVTAVTAAAYLATWAPFLDRYCWSDCTANAFLVRPDADLARSFDAARWAASTAIGLLGVIPAAVWLVRASPVARAIGGSVVAPAGLASLTEAAHGVARLVVRPEWSALPVFSGLFLARAAALSLVAAGLGRLVWQRRRRTAALLALVRQFDVPAAGSSLQSRLSRSLRDPTLTVAYRLPDGRQVDENGEEIRLRGATTTVVRDGQPLAVVAHEQGILDDHARRRIGSAALLAIDNERLNAELRAHLEDLRASRRRIVTTADETRRRLERDLHDGAQQTLLAVLYELHRAKAEPGRGEDERAELTRLIDSALWSVGELRTVAHGIFPAVLEEPGLEAALWTLAQDSDPAVRIASVPSARLSREAERTAYLVVAETIRSSRPGAGELIVHAGVQDEILVLELHGRGIAPAQYLIDRVGAMDGAVTYGPDELRAEIPCG